MTTIQILGTGCKKCATLKQNTEAALEQLGVAAQVQKVEDINEILGYGVMMSPALVVYGRVKIVGRVASADEIAKLLPGP